MRSAFFVHGQVQSTICPGEISGKPPGATPPLLFFFLRIHKPPPQAPGPPLLGEDFFVWYSWITDMIPDTFTLF